MQHLVKNAPPPITSFGQHSRADPVVLDTSTVWCYRWENDALHSLPLVTWDSWELTLYGKQVKQTWGWKNWNPLLSETAFGKEGPVSHLGKTVELALVMWVLGTWIWGLENRRTGSVPCCSLHWVGKPRLCMTLHQVAWGKAGRRTNPPTTQA